MHSPAEISAMCYQHGLEAGIFDWPMQSFSDWPCSQQVHLFPKYHFTLEIRLDTLLARRSKGTRLVVTRFCVI